MSTKEGKQDCLAELQEILLHQQLDLLPEFLDAVLDFQVVAPPCFLLYW